MAIEIRPQDEEVILSRVKRGDYTNTFEVFHEALLALAERERLDRLRALVAEGSADYDADRVTEWSAGHLKRLRERATEKRRLGLPVNPDVCQ